MKLFSAEKMNGGSFIERHSRKIGAGLVIGTIAGFFIFLGGQFGLFQKFNSLALWLGHSAISVVEAGSQPNVVVIMADDLDSGITAFLVNNGFMPNLKRYLIDEGTAFNESFVTNAVCCPARATYLTGQYSHNNGVLTNMLPKGGASLLKDESTLAVWLQAVGYRTSYIGKYLNAYGTSDMNHDGVVDAQDELYIPPGWNNWQAIIHPAIKMYDYEMSNNGAKVLYGSQELDYQTDVLAGLADAFIRTADSVNDGQPFFLSVTPSAPHVEPFNFQSTSDYFKATIRPAPRHIDTIDILPSAPPSFNEEDMSDKPSFMQSLPLLSSQDKQNLVNQLDDKLEAMRAVDDLIGTVMRALEESQELDNTVVIFTSDNGFFHGQHRLSSKLLIHEESIRVPLYVRVPGLGAGQTIAKPVVNNDLAPTIVEFAGATPGIVVDGTSLLPLLQDPTINWRKRFLVEHWDMEDQILSSNDYVGLRTSQEDLPLPNLSYARYFSGDLTVDREFYDLVLDPYQLTSIHDDTSASRLNQLDLIEDWIQALKNCQGDTCRTHEFADTLLLENQAPVADAGPDQTVSDIDGDNSEAVMLNGSNSFDPDGAIDAYEWTEGTTLLGNTAVLTHSFALGSHTVTLTVIDNDSATASDTVTITVNENQAPVADAGPDQTAFTGETVTLNGSGSTDDGSIQSYVWDFGDGATASGVTVSHVYTTADTYTVSLTVTDNSGLTASDTAVITVSQASDMALSVTGFKAKGLQKADLEWSGAVSTNVDIYRDGSIIATAPNDGFYRDNINNRGGGTYVYKVCESDSSVCSNEASVSF